MSSALYQGVVIHGRVEPKKHHFHYKLFLFWLDLENIEQTCRDIKGLAYNRRGLVQFKREDYLDQPSKPLHVRALERMNELSDKPLKGKVYFLGQLRTLGFYFSPVNFYYLQGEDGHFTHLLAEVSNTPWDQRHHYLVTLPEKDNPHSLNDVISPTEKAFHVSPFNPMDMEYRWQVSQPGEKLNLSIACYKKEETPKKHFVAGIQMRRLALTSRHLKQQLMAIPSTAMKTLFGIYWQALKLFIKRMPFYSAPKT